MAQLLAQTISRAGLSPHQLSDHRADPALRGCRRHLINPDAGRRDGRAVELPRRCSPQLRCIETLQFATLVTLSPAGGGSHLHRGGMAADVLEQLVTMANVREPRKAWRPRPATGISCAR